MITRSQAHLHKEIERITLSKLGQKEPWVKHGGFKINSDAMKAIVKYHQKRKCTVGVLAQKVANAWFNSFEDHTPYVLEKRMLPREMGGGSRSKSRSRSRSRSRRRSVKRSRSRSVKRSRSRR